MRNRSGRLFSFRGFGLVLVLVGVFPAAALAQSSDPRPTLPETNIYEQLTYEPENGVPVKKGWILFKSEWPKQPQLGEILYTPWGAPRMFWMCVDFPQLGNNGTICAYTDFFPYPPPPNVPEIPGTREWYCMWATNILIYSKPFNIGTCGWQNPSKGIREGSFKYTDQAGANGLQQALEAIDFMNSGSGDPGDTEPQPEPDPDQQALEAYLDKLIDKINTTTRWRLMAEQRGIDQLTEEERLRLLNLMKADASCLMIGQQIRQHQIDGLENVDVFMVSSAKIYIDLARFGPISEATSVILDIGQAVLEGEDSEAVYILDIVKLAIADTEPPGNKPPHEQALSVIEQGSSLVENTNEAVRSYKAMLQDARKIGELKSAHQVRCTPVVNQGGRR